MSRSAAVFSWIFAILAGLAALGAVPATWLCWEIVRTRDGWAAMFFLFAVTPALGGASLLAAIGGGWMFRRHRGPRDRVTLWLAAGALLATAGQTAAILLSKPSAC